MKKLCFLLILLTGCATATVEQSSSQEIITLEGMTQQQIYDKSLGWLATSYGSAKEVIEEKNPTEGHIIGNVISSTTYMMAEYSYLSTLIIQAKDGKARLSLQAKSKILPNGQRGQVFESEKDFVKQSHQKVIDGFTSYMKENKSLDKDW